MKRKIVIEYNWRGDTEGFQEILEDEAEDRISKAVKDGEICGQLFAAVVPVLGEEKEFQGYFEIDRES